MEIINRQNSDKTQGKKYKLKSNTQQFHISLVFLSLMLLPMMIRLCLFCYFCLFCGDLFLLLFWVYYNFFIKKKLITFLNFWLTSSDIQTFYFNLMFFYAFFPFFAVIFYSVVLFFLLFAVMQCTSLIIFRWQIKTLMVKIPIKQMTSDRFYVHKIRCDKKNSSLNSKWPFLYYLLTHKALE